MKSCTLQQGSRVVFSSLCAGCGKDVNKVDHFLTSRASLRNVRASGISHPWRLPHNLNASSGYSLFDFDSGNMQRSMRNFCEGDRQGERAVAMANSRCDQTIQSSWRFGGPAATYVFGSFVQDLPSWPTWDTGEMLRFALNVPDNVAQNGTSLSLLALSSCSEGLQAGKVLVLNVAYLMLCAPESEHMAAQPWLQRVDPLWAFFDG